MMIRILVFWKNLLKNMMNNQFSEFLIVCGNSSEKKINGNRNFVHSGTRCIRIIIMGG